jgi:hypothetical protein
MKNRSVIKELSRQCGESLCEEYDDDEPNHLDALTDARDYLQSYLDRIDEFIGEVDDDVYLLTKTYSSEALSSKKWDDLNYYLSDVSEALIRLGRQVEERVEELDGRLKDAG